MLAIVASCVIFFYALVPAAIFRTIFSYRIPLRYVQRDRLEQIWVDICFSLLPFLVALYCVWHIPLLRSHPWYFPDNPAQKQTDYQLVLSAWHSDAFFNTHAHDYWPAWYRVLARQARLLTWFYVLTVVEGLLFGWLALNWARFRRKDRTRLERIARVLFLPLVSKWHILFEQITEPPDERGTIRLNVMAREDRLYTGSLNDYYLSRSGDLDGIILTSAKRFDRRTYLRDKNDASVKSLESYWRTIPGKILYLPGAEVTSINITVDRPSELIRIDVRKAMNSDVDFEIESIDPAHHESFPSSGDESDQKSTDSAGRPV